MSEISKKPVVSVLLSTYNGHKYIKELVDSVLNQEGVDVILQVRDDGSNDDTIEILKNYNDSRIIINKGTNLGPAKSFLTLLNECQDSDYYAYCDQDDVWYSNKLITAINEIKSFNSPTLFISTYDVVDENLNKLMKFDMNFTRPLRLQETLIYRAPSACNMVFNHSLKQLISKTVPDSARMHDFWTLLVAEVHNCNIITKDVALIQYRQHAGESVGITPSASTRLKRLVKSLRHGNNERWRQAKELYDIYFNDIPNENKRILKEVIDYRDSFKNKLILFKDKQFVTSNTYIDLLFKFSVLIGKF